VRVISRKQVIEWGKKFPDTAESLKAWLRNACGATWESIADVREVYPHADPVEVRSGKIAVVFNIRGNRYRLITAIHFNRQVIYTLRFLTHAEYSKERWKESL
jgi:mRNA interferase HigB